jgi:hypothetical protein
VGIGREIECKHMTSALDTLGFFLPVVAAIPADQRTRRPPPSAGARGGHQQINQSKAEMAKID